MKSVICMILAPFVAVSIVHIVAMKSYWVKTKQINQQDTTVIVVHVLHNDKCIEKIELKK